MRSQVTDTMTIRRIELPTPLPMGSVNAYLLSAGDVHVLIDCGIRTDESRKILLDALADVDLTPSDLAGLVLTHGHVDHVGMTSLFRDAGVPVFSHPDVGGWLQPGGTWEQYRLEFFEALALSMGMPEDARTLAKRQNFLLAQWTDRSVVDVPLVEGSRFPLLPALTVLYVPGHAQAAVALWNPETGDLFGGDQLLPTISSNAVVEPKPGATRGRSAERTKSLLQYRGNLKALAALPIVTVYPGHGAPFSDAHAVIAQRLAEQGERRRQMLDLLNSQPGASAYDIAVAYFPRHLGQPPLILSETLGYLDWLEADGLARSQTDAAGVVRWTAL